MHNEFTAVVERDGEWFIAYCPEVPGANGQGALAKSAAKAFGKRFPLSWRTARSGSGAHEAVGVRPSL